MFLLLRVNLRIQCKLQIYMVCGVHPCRRRKHRFWNFWPVLPAASCSPASSRFHPAVFPKLYHHFSFAGLRDEPSRSLHTGGGGKGFHCRSLPRSLASLI
ncbi:hypothetical protein HGRIS_001760 [Hohenbuehelia grisea]|uniref:Secreted protein n=1 Tax=Hohenbuehelia grisea TaxID=104357 RepID=A0ABR3JJ26_9AGAR